MKVILAIFLIFAVGAQAQTWRQADLTWYTSYPECCSDPNADPTECEEYNGCTWAGYFAFLVGKQTEEWVRNNNIIAVHSKDANQYRLKTLELRKGGVTIQGRVYDMCADSDCNGCCTENSQQTGFLIDIEKYTRQRFNNQGSGIVEWRCIDC